MPKKKKKLKKKSYLHFPLCGDGNRKDVRESVLNGGVIDAKLVHQCLQLQGGALDRPGFLGLEARADKQGHGVHHPVVGVHNDAAHKRKHLLGSKAMLGIRVLYVQATEE
jgi:hypothetical protein